MSNWFSFGIHALTALVLTPYIISHLGKSGYGIWVLVFSIVGYSGFLDLGLHSATIRYTAHYLGLGDHRAVSQVVSTALFLFGVMGVFVGLLSLFSAGPLANFLHIPSIQLAAFKKMVMLIGLAAGISFPRRIFDAVLMAHEDFVLVNLFTSSFLIVRAAAIFAVLSIGQGLIAIGIVVLSLELINLSTKTLFCLLLKRHVQISSSLVSRKTMRALLSFGGLTFIALLGDALRFNIDSLVLGKFLNLEAVAVYGIASALVRLFLRATSSLTVVTFPRLSQLAAEDLDKFRIKYLEYSKFTSIIVAGFTIEIALLAKSFIYLWVGPSFAQSVPIAVVLVIAISTDYMTGVSVNAMKAMNKQLLFAIQTSTEGICNLVLSIVLVNRIGIIGVALGTAIPIAFSKLIIQPIYSSAIVGVKTRNYYGPSVFRPLLSVIVVCVLLYPTGLIGQCHSFLNLVIKAILIAFTYAIVVYFICLDSRERLSLREQLAIFLKRSYRFNSN